MDLVDYLKKELGKGKKIITSILVLSLAFSLYGCGVRESPPQLNPSADTMTEAITETSSDETEEAVIFVRRSGTSVLKRTTLECL
ncbi:MAG: hypothetical protein K6G69_06455 [Lachnospiraceae bacterium]|nr:hypothetical protein [Lachnospiraceae bacterium]